MLIGLGFGTVPSKWTVPFRFAAPENEGAPPAVTLPGVIAQTASAMLTARVRTKKEPNLFACILFTSIREFGLVILMARFQRGLRCIHGHIQR
jgi:hypothetical protein